MPGSEGPPQIPTDIYLAAIADAAEDAIIGESLDGTILRWNRAAERIFGYQADAVIGRPGSILVPPDRHSEEAALLDTVRQGQRVEEPEAERVRQDGTRLDVSVVALPLQDAAGRTLGVLKLIRDLAGRKRVSNLEAMVAERTAHLQQTIAELEGVSYSLSHDLRAPLRTIQGFSQIVLADAGDKLGDQEKELLKRTISAANRLDRLIQDVLSYTRVSRLSVALTTVEVEPLLRQIIDERPELQPPSADIVIQGPLAPVCGHEASLTQCITNLLDNAVKFVAAGQQPRIRIWNELDGNQVRLWFADNGIGIPKIAQARLFGIFQRVHDDKTYPGTGIGLAIVRKAVERMGGSVHVESEPGEGSRFCVQLPLGPRA